MPLDPSPFGPGWPGAVGGSSALPARSGGLGMAAGRAGDAAGNSGPDTVTSDAKGYLFNQPLPYPLRVV